MYLIIGKENCSRCNMVKGVFDKKELDYSYVSIEQLSEEKQNTYKTMANNANQLSFPLIIKDESIINFQEVLNVS
jgi:glutaredoxin